MKADFQWWLLRLVIALSEHVPCNVTSRLRQYAISASMKRLTW